jgi:hypothetical protein
MVLKCDHLNPTISETFQQLKPILSRANASLATTPHKPPVVFHCSAIPLATTKPSLWEMHLLHFTLLVVTSFYLHVYPDLAMIMHWSVRDWQEH